jgi:hypothetical protein
MIDLIEKIHFGEITPDEARTIFDQYIDDFHDGKTNIPWGCEFGFSRYEATAFVHGGTFLDLEYVRYTEWPTICCRCHKPLDYPYYGWWFEHRDNDVPCLRHIDCPS